jgi:hypothetical protein
MPFSRRLALCTRLAEVKAFGDTLGDTGRFQTLINPIHAEIAFDCFAGIRIPLRGSPGTGRYAGFAANAQFTIYEHNAVLGPFLHGTRGAGGHAPWILTVETGHKDIGHPRQVVYFFRADGNDLGQPGANRQIIFGFAVRLAAVAPDAALGILINIVLAHMFSSNLCTRLSGSGFNVQG